MEKPVILLLDNDDGLKQVASTIKDNFDTQVKVDSTDDFYHITENLYLVKTPESQGDDKSSCIEDLFPEKWMNVRLNGKRFNPKSTIDPQTEYGKEIFAKKVVKPNAHEIDFKEFDSILDRIVAVLHHYRT